MLVYIGVLCTIVEGGIVLYSDKYGDISHTTLLAHVVKSVIIDYGWKEPIKSCILKLIDSINKEHFNVNQIHCYCNFIHSLISERGEREYFNTYLYDNLVNACDELRIEHIFTTDVCKIITE